MSTGTLVFIVEQNLIKILSVIYIITRSTTEFVKNLSTKISFLFVKCSQKFMPSVLWRCWLGGRKGTGLKKLSGGMLAWSSGWNADLHMAQQMPLPLTISCSSKSRLVLPFLVLPFWYLFTRVVPNKFQKSGKTTVCVCVCMCVCSQKLL